jgi:hypothetical protein
VRLTDLEPVWLMKDGKRIGFTFVSPTNPKWRQSCFAVQLSSQEQWALFEAVGQNLVQGCNQSCAWTIAGGIDAATFDAMSVMPSLDGSAAGLWHGFITNGDIVGGV